MRINGEVLHWLRASQSTLESYRLDPVFLRFWYWCGTTPAPLEPEENLQYVYGIHLPARQVDRDRGRREIPDDHKLRVLARASSACLDAGRELHLLQPLYLLPKGEDHRDRTAAQARLMATLSVLSSLLHDAMREVGMPYPPQHLNKFAQLNIHLHAELNLAKELGVLPLMTAEESKPR